MVGLRHFNVFRHARLEREVAGMHEQTEAMKRGVMQYIEVGGRQLSPSSAQGVLRRAILAENEVSLFRMRILSSLRDLRRGRHDLAAAELEALIGEDPAEAEPIHLVDVVA